MFCQEVVFLMETSYKVPTRSRWPNIFNVEFCHLQTLFWPDYVCSNCTSLVSTLAREHAVLLFVLRLCVCVCVAYQWRLRKKHTFHDPWVGTGNTAYHLTCKSMCKWRDSGRRRVGEVVVCQPGAQAPKRQVCACVILHGWNRNALLLHVQSRCRRFRPTPSTAIQKISDEQDLMRWEECVSSPFSSPHGGRSGRKKVKKNNKKRAISTFIQYLSWCYQSLYTCTVHTLCTQVSSWTVRAPHPPTPEPILVHVKCMCFCGRGFEVLCVLRGCICGLCGYTMLYVLVCFVWCIVYFFGCVSLLWAFFFFSSFSVL